MNDGTRDFMRDLAKLEKKVANKIVKDAQRAALKPLAEAIKNDAPVDAGELKASIKVKVGPRRKDQIITVISITTSEENPHALRAETGSRYVPAHPFIRPNAIKMTPTIIEDMKNHINQALNDL